jgi:hypothetical protein
MKLGNQQGRNTALKIELDDVNFDELCRTRYTATEIVYFIMIL